MDKQATPRLEPTLHPWQWGQIANKPYKMSRMPENFNARLYELPYGLDVLKPYLSDDGVWFISELPECEQERIRHWWKRVNPAHKKEMTIQELKRDVRGWQLSTAIVFIVMCILLINIVLMRQ